MLFSEEYMWEQKVGGLKELGERVWFEIQDSLFSYYSITGITIRI